MLVNEAMGLDTEAGSPQKKTEEPGRDEEREGTVHNSNRLD